MPVFRGQRAEGGGSVRGVSYQVFARKYRPQNFDSVVGQEHITRTLKNAIANRRLAHAYLFVGPRGTGKTSTARIFAKALNCEKGPTTEPCGVCGNCVEIAEGRSFNVLEFDAASNTQVDKVRELIIETLRYAPTSGKYRIYIVDEVHMLSNSSFNALLKPLEEPPAHVVFIFATTEAHKIPLTILSRCQRFDMRRIPAPLIARQLLAIAEKEGVALAEPAAMAIARGAEGGMRDAESMLDQLVAFSGNTIGEDEVLQMFGFTGAETVARLAGDLIAGDTASALRLVSEQAEAGKDLGALLRGLIGHARNLLIAKMAPEALSEEIGEAASVRIREQATAVRTSDLLALVEGLGDVESKMRWASDKRMHMEVAMVRAVQTLNQATLDDVLAELAAIRGGEPLPEVEVRKAATVPQARPARKPEPKAARGDRAEGTRLTDPGEPKRPGAEAPEETAPAPAAGRPLAELWPEIVAAVEKQRPFIKGWLSLATPLEVEGGELRIGFAEGDVFAMESLMRAEQRRLVEEIASGVAGRAIRLRAETRADLVSPLPVEKEPVAEAAEDDEKIRRALEIFDARLITKGK